MAAGGFPQLVAVSDLLLDPENPRLPDDLFVTLPDGLDAEHQHRLLKHFEEEYDLEELAVSMAEKGYFAAEPLLGLPQGQGNGVVVVEGNRRLATLKLLHSAPAREQTARPEWWDEMARLANERAQVGGWTLAEVPVVPYDDRRRLLSYLGFRHVTGIAEWSPEAKARYVTSLIVRYGYEFREAARAIGSRSDAIKRQFQTFLALEQVREQDESGATELAREFFGTFYRALQNSGIRQYIDIPPAGEIDEQLREPLSDEAIPRFVEVTKWLFGVPAAELPPAISESRDIDLLGQVLEDDDAREVLQDSNDLDLASERLAGDRRSIKTSLFAARRELYEANGEAFKFVGDPEVISEARLCAQVMDRVLETLGEPVQVEEEPPAEGNADAPPE